MRSNFRFRVLLIAVLGLFLSSLLPASMLAQAGDGQYQGESFDFTINFEGDWTLDESLIMNVEGLMELVTLFHPDGFMMIGAYDGTYTTASDMLAPGEGEEAISEDYDSAVPTVIKQDSYGIDHSEAHTMADGSIIIVSLFVPEASYDALLADAQGNVTVNGSRILVGEPIDGSGDGTAITTGTTTRRPRRSGSATETATETTVTRTRRSAATEQATEPPAAEPTQVVVDVPEGHDAYTGPMYGYTLFYNSTVWEKIAEFDTESSDGVRLQSDHGRLTVWTWDGYGTDSVACLDGEVEYYATEDDTVTDLQVATNSDGKELRHESDELSWGVYTLIYTGESGRDHTLVDYIACQPIPGEEAMLIVVFSATPEDYNTGLDNVLDVLESIQYATGHDARVSPTEPAAEPTAEPSGDGDLTSLDGSLYSSANYGFTLDIPLEWDIVSEEVNGGDERLVLNNGTSTVTLWATNAYQGDVVGCVDYAAQQSGLPLVIDRNASGRDFRGQYGDEAFANFVYDNNGTQMLYFVGCQPIPGTDGFLIVIQDVDYTMFSTERKYRSDIENGITFP